MNTPVKFELAKLLDEKGFDKPFQFLRVAGKFRINYENEGDLFNNAFPSTQKPNDWFLAPTIAEIIMWLYEKYGIWVEVYHDNSKKEFYTVLNGEEYKFNSTTEVYEAVIEYTLNNLL